jgi:uncharacterized membrane protein
MPSTEFWDSIQSLPLSQYIGFSYWFPLLESIHVLAISLVVGSILWVDLRLLGVAALSYPTSRMTRELIPWTWAAFCVAAVTGVGLFATRAGAYPYNPAFQIKIGLLLLACVNMAVFQFRTFKDIAAWDSARVPPASAKLAGATSLLLWAGVVLAGRWTGHLI